MIRLSSMRSFSSVLPSFQPGAIPPIRQSEALQAVWAYIKKNRLQGKGGFVNPDASLSSVVGAGEIASHEIPREVSRFVLRSRAPHECMDSRSLGLAYFPHL